MAAAETRVPTAKIALAEREASMDGNVPPRRVANGLRVSELVGLRWDMLNLAQGHLQGL